MLVAFEYKELMLKLIDINMHPHCYNDWVGNAKTSRKGYFRKLKKQVMVKLMSGLFVGQQYAIAMLC